MEWLQKETAELYRYEYYIKPFTLVLEVMTDKSIFIYLNVTGDYRSDRLIAKLGTFEDLELAKLEAIRAFKKLLQTTDSLL